MLGQGPGEGPRGWAVQASPFLIFALLVQRAATELASAAHVPERTGLRQRVPLFDAPALRDFLADTARRLFLAELLASFTRVASGRYRVRVAGRARTRRFSELDPVRLAGLLDAVPEAERPGVYRRLGDVSLFLTGVFPDYVTARALGPVDAGRLLRAAGLTGPQRERLAAAPAIELLEHLGARWYRTACELAPVRTARLAVAGDVAGAVPAGPAGAQPSRRPVPARRGPVLVHPAWRLAKAPIRGGTWSRSSTPSRCWRAGTRAF